MDRERRASKIHRSIVFHAILEKIKDQEFPVQNDRVVFHVNNLKIDFTDIYGYRSEEWNERHYKVEIKIKDDHVSEFILNRTRTPNGNIYSSITTLIAGSRVQSVDALQSKMTIENTRKSNPFTICSERSNQAYSFFLTQTNTLRIIEEPGCDNLRIIETAADSGGAEIRRQTSGGRASRHNSRIPAPAPPQRPQRDDHAARVGRQQQTTIHVDF